VWCQQTRLRKIDQGFSISNKLSLAHVAAEPSDNGHSILQVILWGMLKPGCVPMVIVISVAS